MRGLWGALWAVHALHGVEDHCGGCGLENSDGPDLPLPSSTAGTVAARRASASGVPAQIVIAALNRDAFVLDEAVLLDFFADQINADPTVLPNTTVRGLSLHEGSSNQAFFAAVDYAHIQEGACVTLGVTKSAKQPMMGPIAAHRNTNHGFYVDTVLSAGKTGADFGTTFGLFGYSQLVPRFLDMIATLGVRKVGILFPFGMSAISESFRFEQKGSRDIAIGYDKLYDEMGFDLMSDEEIVGFAQSIVDGIVASKVTVMMMCFCGTKNVLFRVSVMRLANEAGLFGPGYQWYTHHLSLRKNMEPLLAMPELVDLVPLFDHFKIMDIPGMEPDTGMGAAIDSTDFEASFAGHVARFDASLPNRGYDSLRWLDCDGAHAGTPVCERPAGTVASRLLQYDMLWHIARTLHALIYDGGVTDFCDVDSSGHRTGDPAAFLAQLAATPSHGLSGYQEFERVQLAGGTALALSRTWAVNDWTAQRNHDQGAKYDDVKVSDMYTDRLKVADDETGAKVVVHADLATGDPRPLNEITWGAGVVGSPPRDWSPGMCGMGARVDVAHTAKLCIPCPVYHFNPTDEVEECVPIAQFECPAGTIMDAALISSQVEPCVPCAAGSFSPGGSYDATGGECVVCDEGTYAPEPGASACSPCPRTFTTLLRGARQLTSCTCAPGTFWNRRDDVCDACPSDAFCAGGLDVPVVYSSKHGVLDVESITAEQLETEKQAKLAGEFVPGAQSLSTLRVYHCSSASQCPGETMHIDLAYVGGISVDKAQVRPVSPLAGGCLENREGPGCGRCADGYIGKVECEECQGGDLWMGSLFVLATPLLAIAGHSFTTSTASSRVTASLIFTSLLGTAAFFVQTIAVMDSFNFGWPVELGWLFSFARIFLLDLDGVSMSCMWGSRFAAKYWASLSLPVGLIVATVVGALLSRVLPVKVMQLNTSLGMIGMMSLVLYVTITKVVLAFFECVNNPNGQPTLAKYRDVICYSEEHDEGIAPMALGMMFYVLGFYCLCLHAAYTATDRWRDASFQLRFKFLLSRWRPNLWYWGMVVISRNLLISTAALMSSAPRGQLCFVVLFLTASFTLTGALNPWRIQQLNHFDVASSFMLAVVGIFGMAFLADQGEADIYRRFGQEERAVTAEAEVRTYAALLLVFIGVFCSFFVGLLGYCVRILIVGVAAMTQQEAAEAGTVVQNLLEFIQADQAAAKQLYSGLAPYDRTGVKDFSWKLRAAVRGAAPGASSVADIPMLLANRRNTMAIEKVAQPRGPTTVAA